MSFLFRRIKDRISDKSNDDKPSLAKCKECGMTFQEKGRLEVHRKKAHSGKGERKKNQGGMH